MSSERNEFEYDKANDYSAARPLLEKEDMLPSQFAVIRRIVVRAYEIAEREAHFERQPLLSGSKEYTKRLEMRRPNQVFFIDGARGAGKTSVLLTLQHLLDNLGAQSPDQTYEALIKVIQQTAISDVKAQVGRTSTDIKPNIPALTDLTNFSLSARHDVGMSKVRKSTIPLRVIYPADLEGAQPLLGGIFAAIDQLLSIRIGELEDSKSSIDQKTAKTLAELRDQLHTKIAAGWYLSRAHGREAILRDSINYHEYLKLTGEASVSAHYRVKLWRDYVVELLGVLEAQTLTIFLDDADNHPSVTLDILNTIRVFLDHPKIVTILAGNLKQIRQSVLTKEFEELGEAMQVFRRAAPANEREWRQFARRHAEEYLEKVLPRPSRFFLTIGDEKEYETILGVPFDVYSANQMDLYRAKYNYARWRADGRYRAGEKELQSEQEMQDIEHFMSWWLLRFWYEDALRPRTVRHLLALRAYTYTYKTSPGLIDASPKAHQKRLPVILFENPDNHALIHRFSDTDKYVNTWLHQQIIGSEWVGDRYIEINDIKHYADTYSYNYLLYRLDLDAALPIRYSDEGKVPISMLPGLAGPNLVGKSPFFEDTKPPVATGIAAQINHSLIPANCYFLHSLTQLPDNAFVPTSPTPDSVRFSHRLIHTPERFFNIRSHTQLFDDAQNAHHQNVLRYVQNVVFPVAALAIGQFVSPTDAEGSEYMGGAETSFAWLCSSSLLQSEWDGHSRGAEAKLIEGRDRFFRHFLERLFQIASEIDYFDGVVNDSPLALQGTQASSLALTRWDMLVRGLIYGPNDAFAQTAQTGPADPVPQIDVPPPLRAKLLKYRLALNDIRRAWHASRIFLSEIAGPLPAWDGTIRPSAVEHPSTARVEIMTCARLYRVLGKPRKHFKLLFGNWTDAAPVQALIEQISPGASWFHYLAMGEEHSASQLFSLQGDKLRALLIKHAQDAGVEPFAPANPASTAIPEDKLSLFAIDAEDRLKVLIEARIGRSYIAFTSAIAPLLPALMHCEYAAEFYAARISPHSKTLEIREEGFGNKIAKLHQEWDALIKALMILVLRYLATSELAKLRQDFLGNRKNSLESQAASAIAAFQIPGTSPDFSFTTLGVLGAASYFADVASYKLKYDEFDGDSEDWKILQKVAETGTLRNTLVNLIAAVNFNEVMKKVSEDLRK